MAMEIRWDDKIVEVSEDKNGGIKMSGFGLSGTWQLWVSVEGKNYTIGAIEGPDSSAK